MTTKLVAIGWALFGPSALILFMLALGTALLFTRRFRAGRIAVAAALGLMLAITFLPLDSWALRPLENRFPRVTIAPAHVDGVIVLGGLADPDANGTAGLNEAAERLTTFAQLARLYPEARLVFTGTSPYGPGRVSEADAVKGLMGDLGIDPARITLERKSWDTFENAKFSKMLVDPKPGKTWILVTSASHMPRAVGVFRKVGWSVLPWPTAYKSGSRYTVNLAMHLMHCDLAFHEWVGLVEYRLLVRTDTLFPVP
jgi:uncharacterized SAM-binding protein YcdF (DUF218 family)